MADLITVKITKDARKMLRVLAADSGKTMHRIVTDLAWAEMKRLKLRIGEKAQAKLRGPKEK